MASGSGPHPHPTPPQPTCGVPGHSAAFTCLRPTRHSPATPGRTHAVGQGVVGYLEVDFVQPTPAWDGFKRSPLLDKLEVSPGLTIHECLISFGLS